MKYKILNVFNENQGETQYGTCELCFHTDVHVVQIFEIQDEDGETYDVEAGLWECGEYYTPMIENLVEFGLWLETYDAPNINTYSDPTRWLFDAVFEYNGGDYEGD